LIRAAQPAIPTMGCIGNDEIIPCEKVAAILRESITATKFTLRYAQDEAIYQQP